MIKIIKDFRANQIISSQLAITFLIILSFAIAWFTVIAGEEISSDTQSSVKSTMYNRIENELDTANTLK